MGTNDSVSERMEQIENESNYAWGSLAISPISRRSPPYRLPLTSDMISRRKVGSTQEKHGLTITSFTIATITDQACLGFSRLRIEALMHGAHRRPRRASPWGFLFSVSPHRKEWARAKLLLSSDHPPAVWSSQTELLTMCTAFMAELTPPPPSYLQNQPQSPSLPPPFPQVRGTAQAAGLTPPLGPLPCSPAF